jgi:hypothetical protein
MEDASQAWGSCRSNSANNDSSERLNVRTKSRLVVDQDLAPRSDTADAHIGLLGDGRGGILFRDGFAYACDERVANIAGNKVNTSVIPVRIVGHVRFNPPGSVWYVWRL